VSAAISQGPLSHQHRVASLASQGDWMRVVAVAEGVLMEVSWKTGSKRVHSDAKAAYGDEAEGSVGLKVILASRYHSLGGAVVVSHLLAPSLWRVSLILASAVPC
jgi:hypothetical protein